ncbi:hypothetical protein [Ruegeria lacuscaerulensis]|uniref:hypothetical protein n=1 Tax=Ruegeria lacuscaerulensis TaxID=55218 RepID=UPI00147A02D9|nr:hypothetical protein [Ruegeria lacuscaerulensis]
MEDKPISIRLGARRLQALEHYLSENPDETRNGVIAGAVESYLKETGFWVPASNEAQVAQDDAPMAQTRPTLSERVRKLEETVVRLEKALGS